MPPSLVSCFHPLIFSPIAFTFNRSRLLHPSTEPNAYAPEPSIHPPQNLLIEPPEANINIQRCEASRTHHLQMLISASQQRRCLWFASLSLAFPSWVQPANERMLGLRRLQRSSDLRDSHRQRHVLQICCLDSIEIAHVAAILCVCLSQTEFLFRRPQEEHSLCVAL